MKRFITAFLILLPMMASAAGKPCDTTLLNDPSDFLEQLIEKFAALKAAKESQAEERQLEEIQYLYKGQRNNLDVLTSAQRNSLSTESIDRKWKESDGTIERDRLAIEQQLKLYGRVLGEKDGVRLVAVPPPHFNWKAMAGHGMPFPMYLVVPISIDDLGAAYDPIEQAIIMGNNLDRKQSEASDLALVKIKEIRKQLFNTETDEFYIKNSRKEALILFTIDGKPIYVERILDIYPDLLLNGGIRRILPAFRQ